MRRMNRYRFVRSGPTPMSAFSLIELLVVVGILSILLTIAMPSWQSVRVASAVREARVVLERLNLHQRYFWQQHTRYAATDELPPLAVLSETVGHYYQLSVESTDAGFLLRLVSTVPTAPSLALDHRGVWTTTDLSSR
uniref:Prepilin-type N-terminal cleavage/methylation domain-containing protein n=1 Tax=uncultured gamma proteobacterium EB000_37F04 TaxID=710971 RepID=E0XZC4_9GAMM|nr:hypothetical protein [uncultured gamma proteobacterium EB000_37F04]